MEHGEILSQSLTCVRKLVWLELQLGRVPAVLQWMDLASAVASNLAITGKRKRAFEEERFIQDGILGILFLRAEPAQLQMLSALPSRLDLAGLLLSRTALLYSLGYEDELRREGSIPREDDSNAVLELACRWAKQPASLDLPATPEFGESSEVVLRSRVLGCEVTGIVANNFASICLAEWTLAALEGLLATSLDVDMFPHAQDFSFQISVNVNKDATGNPEYAFHKLEGKEALTIQHREPDLKNAASGADPKFLQKIVLEILPRIALPRNVQQYAEQVLGREEGFSRAINFSNPAVPLNNILGEKIVMRISGWKAAQSPQPSEFSPRRALPWSHGLNLDPPQEKPSIFENLGDGDPPPELLDFSSVKHSQVRVFSLIDLPLWDKAGWHGVGLGLAPIWTSRQSLA